MKQALPKREWRRRQRLETFLGVAVATAGLVLAMLAAVIVILLLVALVAPSPTINLVPVG